VYCYRLQSEGGGPITAMTDRKKDVLVVLVLGLVVEMSKKGPFSAS
jgi:hypothetical protein